jgi:fructokinase
LILVCGEALIDLFVGPAEAAEMPARAVAGGSPFKNGADLPTEADVEAGLAAPIRIMSGDGMTVLGKCPLV